MKNVSSIKIIIFMLCISSKYILYSDFLEISKEELTEKEKINFLETKLRTLSKNNEILLKENNILTDNLNNKITEVIQLKNTLTEMQTSFLLLKEHSITNLQADTANYKEYTLNEIKNTQTGQDLQQLKEQLTNELDLREQLTKELNQVKNENETIFKSNTIMSHNLKKREEENNILFKENQSFISFIDSVELILKEKGIEITNEEIKKKLLKRNQEIESNMEEKSYELDREKRTNIMLKAENKELENNILKKDKDIELMIEEKKNNMTLLSFYDFFDLLIRNPLFTIISLGAGSLISYVIFFLIHNKKSPPISQ